MNICTIIAKNYVAQARVLAESFRKQHPDGGISVLVADDFDGYLDPGAEPFDLIDIDSIGLADRDRMAASYDVTEFSTAVKPWLIRHLLRQPGNETMTYLDPDVLVVDDLTEIDGLALRHGLVLNPHFTHPLPADGLKPSDEDILIAGAYNLGIISLRAGSESERLLDWWSERLLYDCIVDPDNGYFVDQRWIDLAPGLYPDLHLLRDPGYNLAYWNLPHRELHSEGQRYTVDGEPLRFFHFSGFDPLVPRALSKHQNRIDVSRSPALSQICTEYAEAVRAAGYEEARAWPYGWDMLPGGLELDRYSRRLHRQAVSQSRLNGSVFNRNGAEQLVSYLTEPDDEISAGGGGAVSRYLGEMHRSREDIRIAFPDLAGQDGARYSNWVAENADLLGIPPALRPSEAAVAPSGGGPSGGLPLKTGGVNLAGYLGSELGVGEAARQIASAMSEAGIEMAAIDVPVAATEMPEKLGLLTGEQMPFDVNLLCVNADMVPDFVAATDPRFFADRYSVGIWFWEVGQFPRGWRGSFEPLDEVWAATRHVADAIRSESPIPVETIRLPVTPVDPEKNDRAALGMPDGYCFLFIFDYRSVFKRKNPLGLIESFSRAFDAGSDISLVIKSVGSELYPEEVAALQEAATANPDVHLIEDTVDAPAKNAMIVNCDCYVSLHRSEGFGLTMAEAMYFGKPVIATGYSGNLDFMTAENSYIVEHRLTRVGDDAPPYPAEAMWAEPDIEDAARLMRHVTENREEAAGKGEHAAADIRRTHSPEAAGKVMEGRLKDISKRPPAPPPKPSKPPGEGEGAIVGSQLLPVPPTPGSSGMAQLRHLLQFDEAPPKPGGTWLRRASKRTYLRLLRPYAAYQRRINESAAQALDEVRTEIGRRHVVAEERNREQLQKLTENIQKQLDSRLSGPEDLVAASASPPFMSDQRFGSERHALLGKVIGFDKPLETPGIDSYRGFEDVFRGSEEMIKGRQEAYLELVGGFAPVLDLGCGRGEFLDLLNGAKIEHRGVDIDPGMVSRCHEKGHADVVQADALEYLEKLSSDELGTVFSAQVIEHLEFEQLKRLLERSIDVIRPDGLFIAETVNPHSARALKAFWVDPTHQQPLFPETMLALCQQAGYASAFVFCPNGSGDYEKDRTVEGEYAIVARAPDGGAGAKNKAEVNAPAVTETGPRAPAPREPS